MHKYLLDCHIQCATLNFTPHCVSADGMWILGSKAEFCHKAQ